MSRRTTKRIIEVAASAAFQAGCATIDKDRKFVDEETHDRQITELCRRLRISTVEYFEARCVLASLYD